MLRIGGSRRTVLGGAAILVAAVFGGAGIGRADPTPGLPYNLTIPTVSGTAQVGSTLTAEPGTWSQSATYSYQWYRCSPNNLIGNSGFENDTSGWAAISNGNKPTTISRVSSPVHSGSWSLQVNLANSSFDGVVYTPQIAISPTQTYHFSAWVWVPAAAKWQDSYAERLELNSRAFDGAGNSLSSPPGSSDFNGGGNSFVGPGWTQISSGVGTSIFSQAVAEQFSILNYMANNETVYLDDVWFNACDTIQGATGQSYTPTELDSNNKLMVEVTATNSAGSGVWQSDETAVVMDSEVGTADSDQTPETGDDSTSTPAAPQPMTPSGPAASGTYSTSFWPGDATGSDDGLYVVSSTPSGTTALTGVVQDPSGAPVSDATVTMNCSACNTTVTTTTDTLGSFAFSDMPAGTYNLSTDAAGFGSYALNNDPYAADNTYDVVEQLQTTPITYDEANGTGTAVDNTNLDSSTPGTAYSQRRVPPSIKVEMLNTYPRGSSQFCETFGGPANPPVVNYAFDFYVLHVVQGEVSNLGYNSEAMHAFMSLVQNFAWFHKTKGGTYDVTNAANTYAGQCFRPEEKVSVQQWNTWLQDVLPTRIADGSGNLRETPYASGTTTNCDDPAEPAHAGKASQLGLRTHSSNSSCLVATWQDLADYYYPTSWAVYGPAGTNGVNGTDIFGTLAPPVPVTSYSASGGALTLNFRSHVDGQNTAWKFYLQHLTSSGWRTFKIVKWRHSTRSVPESSTFTPSGCMRYRVKAVNPVNGSAIATTTAAAFTPAGTGLSSAGQCTL